MDRRVGASSAPSAPDEHVVPLPRFGEPGELADGARPIPQGQTATGVRTRDAVYRRALGAGDLAAAAIAVVLAITVLGDDRLTLTAVASLPLVLIVSKIAGLYDRDERLLHKTTLDEAPALFQAATLYGLLIWLGESVFVQGHLSQTQVLGLWGLLFLSMLGARGFVRRVVKELVPAERCLVLGDARAADRLKQKIEKSYSMRAIVVGRVPFESERRTNGGAPVVARLETLGLALVEHDVDRVIIAPRRSDSDEILDAIRLVKSLGVKVSVLPRLFEVVGSSVEFDEVEGVMLLGLPSYGLTKSSESLKRATDVIGSGLCLLALAPLLLLIAAAVKLTSRGPVLFRQTRIGRHGEQFEMLKFRTMYDGADWDKPRLRALNEAEGLFKIGEDPRMTKGGRLLRRSSVDELPQLINVLRGEMSLVGPRPLVPDEDRRVEGWQRKRLQLKPGMTGPWQVLGSSRIPLHEMVKIDYLYTANWSLWGDIKTLLRTVPHMLAGRGL
jgi:exopolysaccharide biosynthesis polyprenyl glycosylphosphotransferase